MTATSDMECYTLDRATFHSLLGPVEDLHPTVVRIGIEANMSRAEQAGDCDGHLGHGVLYAGQGDLPQPPGACGGPLAVEALRNLYPWSCIQQRSQIDEFEANMGSWLSRQETVTATSHMECYTLDNATFHSLLGPCGGPLEI